MPKVAVFHYLAKGRNDCVSTFRIPNAKKPSLAVLPDRGMQQREDIAHALGHDPRDQLVSLGLIGKSNCPGCG
jgi:hypothetical protein